MLLRNHGEETGVIHEFRDTFDSSAAHAHPAVRLVVAWGLATLLLPITPSAVLAQAAKPAGAAAAAAGDAGRGKAVYASVGCAGCHGASGQGGSATAIVPMRHPLPAFTRLVRQPATAAMPPLSPAAASDAQVADLYAYLSSLASKGNAAVTTAPKRDAAITTAPKADAVVATAPAGNAENGKRLYTAVACYACHGYVGQGGSAGPRLGPPAIAFPAFMRAIRHPQEMPPYTAKVLSDAQVADIYAHVKTFPEPADLDTIPLLKNPPLKK